MSRRDADDPPFWKTKRLDEMSRREWESLCDGCGKCCLHKLEDEATGAIAVTDVACAWLDVRTCRCTDYRNRQRNVPDCVKLTPQAIPKLAWLPETCGYRLVHEGKDLEWWHPLVSGDPETVHAAGMSVRGGAVSENAVDDLEEHVTHWLEELRETVRWSPPDPKRRSRGRGRR